MKRPKKNITLSFRLPEELNEKFRKLAESEGLTLTGWLEKAIHNAEVKPAQRAAENLDANQENPFFKISKELLIRISLFLVFGRYRQNPARPIVYAVLNRILLLFQRPVALLIYNGDFLKHDMTTWQSIPDKAVVFKSLSLIPRFGDQELAAAFAKKVTLEFPKKPTSPQDCLFQMFGTKFYIAFFRIHYDKNTRKIADAIFEPLKRDDLKYGQSLQNILLEDNDTDAYHFTNPLNFFGEGFYKTIEKRLDDQFKDFAEAQKTQPLPFKALTKDELGELEKSIGRIKEQVINPIYAKKIESVPFANKACPTGNDPTLIPNAFFFLKTVTLSRTINQIVLPYTLRLILSKGQKAKAEKRYAELGKDRNLCLFYTEGKCRALMDVLEGQDEKHGCILEKDGIPANKIIQTAEKPFGQERDLVDTGLASGNFSYATVYPDFSRSYPAEISPKDAYNELMSKRQAATFCLTLQTLRGNKKALEETNKARKEKEQIKPKAIAVPVHVNGITIASILVVTLHDPKKEEGWFEVYSMTLSVLVRSVNTRIRSDLKKAYLSELTDIFTTGLITFLQRKENGTWLAYLFELQNFINDRAAFLSRVYPFPVITYSIIEDEAYNKPLIASEYRQSFGITIGEEAINFKFVITKDFHFERLFDYNYLKPDDITTYWAKAVHEAIVFFSQKGNSTPN